MFRSSLQHFSDPRWGCAIAVATLVWALTAAAQTVYKWTDDNGVVHFADQPPTSGQPFEQRGGQPAPPVVSQHVTGASDRGAGAAPPSGSADTGTAERGAAGGASKTEQFNGPARVILVGHQAMRRAADTQHVVGSLKNVGGQAALHVQATIRVTDAQGGNCLTAQVDVSPATLESGESGNFDETLQSACLADDGSVDIEPYWE